MLEKVFDALENNDIQSAWKEINSYLLNHEETPETDVLKASILLSWGEKREFFKALAQGFKRNYKNYELYMLLADYYGSINLNQSYICLKQALFFCDNLEDASIIETQIKNIENSVKVRKTSIIILSYNTKDTIKLCLDYLFENSSKEEVEVVVVDNASTDGSVEMLRQYPDIIFVENHENRGFPGGCNDGISMASKENDIFLLNSDAIILPNSLFWLKMGLYENDRVGCTGSVTNYAQNYQMIPTAGYDFESIRDLAKKVNVPMECPYTQKIFLIGFSLMIKKEAMDIVGILDERFNPGNYEDTDYGMRMTEAGYKMMLCKNSFVYHFGHKSFSQVQNKFGNLIERNLQKFTDKWHINLQYYTHTRSELVDFIEKDTYDRFNVLEVGCGCGCTIGYLEGKYPNANIEGIELDEVAAKIGGKLFNIYQDNFESPHREYREEYYDYVIFGDVLEHLYDPVSVLKKAQKMLKRGGCVIASIPNLMHISVLSQLLDGKFYYEESGILDRTHIRFFTLETMIEMFMKAGYEVQDLKGVRNIDGYEDKINRLMPVLGENVTRSQLESYQYYLLAKY